MVGGSLPSWMARTEKTASMPPAAPSRWPVIDFVELIATALTIKHGVIHPTINYETPDPECDLDYVPNEPREARLDYALSNNFGFGGTNAALLFKRYEE